MSETTENQTGQAKTIDAAKTAMATILLSNPKSMTKDRIVSGVMLKIAMSGNDPMVDLLSVFTAATEMTLQVRSILADAGVLEKVKEHIRATYPELAEAERSRKEREEKGGECNCPVCQLEKVFREDMNAP